MPVDDKVAVVGFIQAMYDVLGRPVDPGRNSTEYPVFQRTALDDAIDRLNSNNPYDRNRNPEDSERERRELERLRTEWGFRR